MDQCPVSGECAYQLPLSSLVFALTCNSLSSWHCIGLLYKIASFVTSRKGNFRRWTLEHLGIVADLNTALNASHYPDADSTLKSNGLQGLGNVFDHYGPQSSAGVASV